MRAFGHGSAGLLWVLLSRSTAYALTDVDEGQHSFMNPHSSRVSRQDKNTTIPAPVVASVSQYWEGNDGPWSSFAIQVGNKPQNIRVLPSTASTSTWVVYDQGCPADAPSNCKDSRGGIFNPNNSLTWIPNSIFDLGIEANLDYSVFGDFAFDTVTLGWQGSGGPTVEHSIVAGIGDTAFSWLGVLGLNPRPTNFSTFSNNPQVSFVQALRNQNSIPSVSWAYTAGAPYRLNKVFGSLVLGGYDSSRFAVPSGASPDLTFPFYTDIARDLLVGISSIETSNTTSSTSNTKLLNDGIFAFIDSTVPHLWLPESACKAFESAFGLTWNSTSELYTLNSTQHDALSKLNPSITFTLSPVLPPASTDKSVAIAFPYSAFNLNLSWPHAASSSYYFPLKRAANETQYTLGRAFLQEAYLIADYERSNFSVWPCSWDSDVNNAHIVPIRSLNDTTSDSPDSPGGAENKASSGKKGLSTGAIAGIAIGAAAGVIGAALAAFFWLRNHRRSSRRSFELDATSTSLDPLAPAPAYHPQKETPPGELDSNDQHELPAHHKFGVLEAPGSTAKFELEGTARPVEAVGMKDPNAIHEMDVGEPVFPHIFVEPPTAISPRPDAELPSPLPTPGQVTAAKEAEKRLGYGPEGDNTRDGNGTGGKH